MILSGSSRVIQVIKTRALDIKQGYINIINTILNSCQIIQEEDRDLFKLYIYYVSIYLNLVVSYIRKHLGDTRPDEKEVEVMKADLEASAIKIQTLEDEIKVLKEKLQKYEPLEDKIPMDEDNFPVDTSEEPPSSTSPIEAATNDQSRTGTVDNIPPTE